MATPEECEKCPKRYECPILEAIDSEEKFRALCTEHKGDDRCQKK